MQTMDKRPYSGILFNSFTYLGLLSLWVRRGKLFNMDIFIFTQYIIFTILLNELPIPDVFSRFSQYVFFGVSIIIGRMGAANYRLGFIMLMLMFINFYHHLHFDLGFNVNLSNRVYSEFMNPVYGLFAYVSEIFGLPVVNWLAELPLLSIIIMLSWQWTPFALLIFMTSLQSMDQEQIEAAEIEGAGFWSKFHYLTLPHLSRAIAVVVMIQAIFHLGVFAEIYVTTGGGPGYDSTNTTWLIFKQALLAFDVGVAAAGGVFAIIVANIIAFFLIKTVAKGMAK